MGIMPVLSLQDYMEGVRCPLSLWHEWQKRAGVPAEDPGAGQEIRREREIVTLARQYFAADTDVIFDVAAVNPADNTSVCESILKKIAGRDEYELIGVSASMEVKQRHAQDLAFQMHVLKGAGYKIRGAGILLMNRDYVRSGAVDPQALLTYRDMTRRVHGALKDVPGNIAHIRDAAGDLQAAPSFAVSLECGNPFDCPHRGEHGIPQLSVFNVLSREKARAVAMQTGSLRVEDIPDDALPATFRAVDIACAKSGREHVDAAQLQAFAGGLRYPLYFLDYETIADGMPFFDGTRPHRQVPFQFSLHVRDTPGGPLVHHEFLHQDRSDPRRAFTEALLRVMGEEGSVIVYNEAFEASRNRELGEDFPEYADALNAVNARMIDLYQPFKVRALYHPAQQGSASIKYVLPAFTDMSYADLEIGNGQVATDAYAAYIRNRPGQQDPARLFDNLRQYCGRDTMAMVRLLDVVIAKAFPSAAPSLSPA